MNIINPAVPIIFNPRRRDKAVQSLSVDLGVNLDWLSHAFGKATVKDKKVNNQRVRYPAIYKGKGEYTSVSHNSFLTGSTYFLLGRDEYLEEDIIQFETSIVVMVNLKKIYPTLEDYEATERIIEQIDHVIAKLDSRFVCNSVEHDFDDVFREFDDMDLFDLKTYPLDSFRINGKFTLDLECLGGNITPGSQGDLTNIVDNFVWNGDNLVWKDGDNLVW